MPDGVGAVSGRAPRSIFAAIVIYQYMPEPETVRSRIAPKTLTARLVYGA